MYAFYIIKIFKGFQNGSTWYYSFYKSSDNILDFTLDQIDKFEKIALRRKIVWTFQN